MRAYDSRTRVSGPTLTLQLTQISCEGCVVRGDSIVPFSLRDRPPRRVRGAHDGPQCLLSKLNRMDIARPRVTLFVVSPDLLPELTSLLGQSEDIGTDPNQTRAH